VSALNPLKTDTITVASQTGLGPGGDPQYGTRQTVNALVEDATTEELSDDTHTLALGLKVTTDDYEFEATDAIWPPGADTTDTAEAYQPEEVGAEDMPATRLRVSYAML
jgi:hypothetical protein